MDSSRLAFSLGWRPKVDTIFEDGIRLAIRGFLRNAMRLEAYIFSHRLKTRIKHGGGSGKRF